MATARARSHAELPAEEAPEAPKAPEKAPETEKTSGVSADVQAVRESHANLPVIGIERAPGVEVDQPTVLEQLSADRRRLQREAQGE